LLLAENKKRGLNPAETIFPLLLFLIAQVRHLNGPGRSEAGKGAFGDATISFGDVAAARTGRLIPDSIY
jgi:hypothetical protein